MNPLGDTVQGIKDVIEMSKIEVAQKLLPKDTKFAITAQAYILAPGSKKASVFDPDSAEFKIVYLAVTDSELVVLDDKAELFRDKLSNVEASYGDLKSGYKEVGIEMHNEGNIPMTGAYARFGGCVIKVSGQVILAKNPGPIVGAKNQFESSVTGTIEGFSPLFARLEQGGAQVSRPSNSSLMIWWIIGLGIMAGFLYWLVQFKK